MKVTHEQMVAARVPVEYRDYCAHILIPLNECRIRTWYSPFKCTELRHGYEKCQYDECAPRAAPCRAARGGGRGPTRARVPTVRRYQRRIKILDYLKSSGEWQPQR